MDVKIADFGLATRLSTPLEKHYTLCGTPNYISPEIATRNPHGLESDVWSLGCLLYTCLVGKPPFDSGDSVRSTLNKVAGGEYKLPNHLSHEAKDLICKLLQKNPSDRIYLSDISKHPFMSHIDISTYKRHSLSPPVKLNSSTKNYFSESCSSQETDIKGVKNLDISQNSICSSNTSTSCSSCTQSPFSISSYSSQSCGRNTQSDEEIQKLTPCSVLACTNKRSPRSDKCLRHSHYAELSPLKSILVQNSVNVPSQVLDLKSLTISDDIVSTFSEKVEEPSQPVFRATTDKLSSKNIIYDRNVEYFRSTNNARKNADGKENQNPIFSPKNNQCFEKRMKPLSSIRLRPFRQKTRNTVTSVLEDESICLEFLQTRDNHEYVIEVMHISPDGIKVTIFHPNGKIGVLLMETPQSVPSSAICYTFALLPEKYWKKYQYADKFVRLLKMKTPKLTLYSSRAKCSLMESGLEDFEALFYDGSRVHFTENEKKVEIEEKSKKDQNEKSVAIQQSNLLIHAKDLKNRCQVLFHHVISLPDSENYFPLVVGRRPSNHPRKSFKRTTEPIISKPVGRSSFVSPPALSVMSYDGTVLGGNDQSQFLARKNYGVLPTRPTYPARASSTSSLDRVGLDESSEEDNSVERTFIKNVGWASKLKSGEIQIQFNDGTELKYNSLWQRIIYIDQTGKLASYKLQVENPPTEVRDKLHHILHLRNKANE